MIVNSQKRLYGGRTKVSSFTLGTMRAVDNAEKMYQVIKHAYFAGINHIETAQSYGRAEFFIGKALEQLQNENNINKKNANFIVRLHWVYWKEFNPKINI